MSVLRTLIVDDETLARSRLRTLLADCKSPGAEVVAEAAHGAGALDQLAGTRFDLVLLDIHMPGLDGIAVARAIRALPAAAGQVPIVAVTADLFRETRERCRAAGINDQVAKPIVPGELLERIAAHMDLVSTA
jgi:CheY-like chemotaxis protein